jgi:hypothetical protein
MRTRTVQSLAGKLTVIGLVVAAAGISTLFLTSSVAVPPIPIGPILLLLVAGVVALGPWRWTPVVGVIAALFVLGGAFIAPGLFDRLSTPAQLGGFVGTWVQMVGLLTALVAGTLAAVQNYQTQATVGST